MENHNKIKRYLKFLAEEAKDSTGASRCRLCAMIVYKGMPISLGRNKMKSHPMMLEYGRTEHHIFLHAEIDAIIKAQKELTPNELKKSTLYVCRVLADGRPSEARPCPGCARAMREHGIQNIVWTTYNGYTTTEEETLDEENAVYEARKAVNKHKINSLHLPALSSFA